MESWTTSQQTAQSEQDVNSHSNLKLQYDSTDQYHNPPAVEVTQYFGRPPATEVYDGLSPSHTCCYVGILTPQLAEKDPNGKSKQGPCGLGAVAFSCLVALLTAVLVGAAVGGGIGSSLSHERNENK